MVRHNGKPVERVRHAKTDWRILSKGVDFWDLLSQGDMEKGAQHEFHDPVVDHWLGSCETYFSSARVFGPMWDGSRYEEMDD